MKFCVALTMWWALLQVLIGCDIPKDPNHTLERVRGGSLRVGVVDNPPWTSAAADEGLETRLVRELAAALNTQIYWYAGTEHELLSALEHFELDLVIGGFVRGTPWNKRVALSRPYYNGAIVIAAAADPPLHTIKGLRIATPPGSASAAYVREQGGIPVPPTALGLPRVMSDWQAVSLGLQSGMQLQKQQYVVALPPGENRWIITVERFLYGQQDRIAAELRGL